LSTFAIKEWSDNYNVKLFLLCVGEGVQRIAISVSVCMYVHLYVFPCAHIS